MRLTGRRAAAGLAGLALALGGCGVESRVGQIAPAPAPGRVDPAHPPMSWGGPDGRSALDGTWVERSDRPGRGEALGWFRGTFDGRPVTIPFSPNAGTVRGAAGLHSFQGSIAWYRTTFTTAQAGDYALRFESVNHRATVWVDGRLVARHTGVYLPFEAELALAPGAHTLVVRADWRSPARMKATSWHRTWFNFGGINREVTLRPLGRSALDGPAVRTRLRGGAAIVDVSVGVRNRGRPRVVRVRGTLAGHGLRFAPLRLGAGERGETRAQVRIAHPDLWAPGHPALAELHLEVPGESGWTERAGLRELRWSGGRLRLNGRPLRLRGASLHEDAEGRGDALVPADMDAIIQRLRAIRANATRAQHLLSPALLERLDAAGILVWQEVGPVDAPGNWTSNTPALRAVARERVIASVRTAGVHPSVMAWMLGNEVANNGHSGGQAAWINASARLLHRMDSGRPVALDVWGSALPANDRGLMYRHVDAIGVTLYEGWYQRPGESSRSLTGHLRRRLAQARRTFGGRVLVATEFGAEASGLNPAPRPGGVDYQARLLGRHIAVYRGDPTLDGWLVWVLQDFALVPSFRGGSIRRTLPDLKLVAGVNQKGLFTYGGQPKPAVEVVRDG
ncbi:MAG TPA: glycoside hydrolase family 2 TIM barrel-domain containing protein [Solirubrobacteraceae bacterium]|nr:glycoside hydrolase family 2 TIM barrel-domain containing protein [Solirubrobacteraceae bacterium]